MKIFVRSDTDGVAQVIARYDDDAEVPTDAHGKDAQVFIVPNSVLRRTAKEGFNGMTLPTLQLADNWRDSAVPPKPSLGRLFTALEKRVAALESAARTGKTKP